MKKLNSIRGTTSAALLVGVVTVPFSANAAKQVEIKVSGQVSRALTYADNGTEDDFLSVDNLNSGTRFRLTGKTEVRPGLSAGVAWETQFQDNSSGSTDIGSPDDNGAGSLQSRKRELWFQGGFGKISLGKGDGAANGTSEIDLSGTFIADYSGNNLDDGISFADSSGNKVVRNNQVFTNFDGLSRNDRIRYDFPKFGDVGVAISAGQDMQEFALRYNKNMGGGAKLAAGLGYVGDDDSDFTQLGLSASYLASNGFNITGMYGSRDRDDRSVDSEGYYIKVGKKFGKNAVTLSYNAVDDLNAIGDEAERVNLSYVHNMANGIEIFGTVQNSSLDRASGPDLDDVNQFSIGSRIKF